jgi:hypothetical protein
LNKNKILRFRFIVLVAIITVFIFDVCSIIYESEEFIFAFFAIVCLMYGFDMIGFWKILIGRINMAKEYIKNVWKKICGICEKPFSKGSHNHKKNHLEDDLTLTKKETKRIISEKKEEGNTMAVAKKKKVAKKKLVGVKKSASKKKAAPKKKVAKKKTVAKKAKPAKAASAAKAKVAKKA